MYNNILVTTGSNLAAENVVVRAFNPAQSGDTSIHVLHIIGPDVRSIDVSSKESEEWRQQSEKRRREATVRIQEQAENLGLDVGRTVHEGTPYWAIYRYLDRNDIDLVEMETHGRTADADRFLGSTTARAGRRSNVPG